MLAGCLAPCLVQNRFYCDVAAIHVMLVAEMLHSVDLEPSLLVLVSDQLAPSLADMETQLSYSVLNCAIQTEYGRMRTFWTRGISY